MSDATTSSSRPCCGTDWLLPKALLDPVVRAAEEAVKDRGGKLKFPPYRAREVFLGTKYSNGGAFEGLEATWRQDLLWENGQTVMIGFRDDMNGHAKEVLKIAQEWCEFANLTFVEGDPQTADIRVTFSGRGFMSDLGKMSAQSKPQPSMTLGFNSSPQKPDFFRRLVLHEFGHAIGLEHEHAHRKSKIVWNEPELLAYLKKGLPPNLTNEQILDQVKLIGFGGAQWEETAYDLDSIMRYSFPRETFISGWDPKFDTEALVLSDGDKAAARQMYPGRPDTGGGGGGGGATKQKAIKVGDTEKDSIKQGELHRYAFDPSKDGIYAITTGLKATVRIELLTADGKKPASTEINVSDAKSPGFGAIIQPFLEAGKYIINVCSSPFDPGSSGEGEYSLTVEKTG